LGDERVWNTRAVNILVMVVGEFGKGVAEEYAPYKGVVWLCRGEGLG
jgi:hypothetical protein